MEKIRRQCMVIFMSYCYCPVTQSCLTRCDPMDCSILDFTVLHHLLEFVQTHVHWVSDATQPSHSLLSPSPLAFSFSQHQNLFQWVGSSHQVAKVLELHLHHQSFQWNIQGWFPLRVIGLISMQSKGTLKSLLQHHSSKASILQCLAFFIIQLSHPYMTTGKTIALTRRDFVGKVMSLLFNMLSRFIIAFLPRSKGPLI